MGRGWGVDEDVQECTSLGRLIIPSPPAGEGQDEGEIFHVGRVRRFLP